MPRPALKVSIPYFVADGGVHFRMGGELTSLEETDGRVQALLELLDGTREPDRVHHDLAARFPDVTRADVDDALAALDESGLVQDATDEGGDFTADHRERWSNNLGFFETYASLSRSKYDFQRRIRDAKVGVLGVGGIGSHVFIDLVAIGFEDIRILDFDRIEVSNFNRQIIYGEPDVGRVKVEVAAERARALNSNVRVSTIQKKLTSADDVYEAVHDRDVVIAVVDRPKVHVMHWLNEGCVRAGTVLIGGGVDTQRAFHYSVVPGLSGCLECWYRSVQDNDPTSRMVQGVLDDIDREGGAFGEDTAAFNGLVAMDASLMVGEMVRFTSRVSPPLSIGRMLGLSFHDPRLEEFESWKRLPDCAVCGSTQPAESMRWLESDDLRLPF
ncbi:ThiF family adenylyltransferase [Actinosynnema sp. NPDC023658]|uniref:ThiF family adenylyltransferase n=1 Tax=Actinosynnema sp. NPDC023658 TaxID=3155465 RepID=UPI0033DECEC9